MHKLTRSTVPRCLNQYKHGKHTWADVNCSDKAQIWQQLDLMQHRRCAYCEASLNSQSQELEHFIQRAVSPHLTFDWSNIFGSCKRKDSCGQYKDTQCFNQKTKQQLYNHQHLLKPDCDNPDDFFTFVVDGSVQVKQGLSEQDQRKALETIRVFNLNCPSLQGHRSRAVGGIWSIIEEIREMAECFAEEEWKPFYHSELERIATQPFCTALRHAFLM